MRPVIISLLLSVVAVFATPAAPQPAKATVSWGEERDGIRIGLGAKHAAMVQGAKFLKLAVWYENTDSKPAAVPVHIHESVNSSRLMFVGDHHGARFFFGHFMTRLATSVPKMKTLKPGETFREQIMLHVGKPGSALGYAGLPEANNGESFTLQLGLCERIDPHTEKDWQAATTLKSGEIKVTMTEDRTRESGAALKKNSESLFLEILYFGKGPQRMMPGVVLHPQNVSFQPMKNVHYAPLKEDEAEKLIDGLATTGVFRHTQGREPKFDDDVGYVLRLRTKRDAMYEILGKPTFLRILRNPKFQIAGANGSELFRDRMSIIISLVNGRAKEAVETYLKDVESLRLN